MKLTKAIEIIADSAHGGTTTFNQDYKDAQKLLIEAGKRIKACREPEGGSPIPPLKGETED